MNKEGALAMFVALLLSFTTSVIQYNRAQDWKKSYLECEKRAPDQTTSAYMKINEMDKKTIALLYQINTQEHHRNDSLQAVINQKK